MKSLKIFNFFKLFQFLLNFWDSYIKILAEFFPILCLALFSSLHQPLALTRKSSHAFTCDSCWTRDSGDILCFFLHFLKFWGLNTTTRWIFVEKCYFKTKFDKHVQSKVSFKLENFIIPNIYLYFYLFWNLRVKFCENSESKLHFKLKINKIGLKLSKIWKFENFYSIFELFISKCF